MQMIKATSNTACLTARMVCQDYRMLQDEFSRAMSFAMVRFTVALCVVLAVLAETRIMSTESRYRTRKWGYTSASCSATSTTITCSGTGSITEEMVQKTGQFDKYTVARVEWGVTRLEQRAFRYCSSLIDVSLPESVVYLGQEVFIGFKGSSITFPSSVTELNPLVVNGNTFITHVNMAFQNGTYRSEDGMIMQTKNGYKGLHIVGAGRCQEFPEGKTLEIPSVDKIWRSAVRRNQADIIKVPDSVIEIQTLAFFSCKMHTLELGKRLQNFDKGAIISCTALTAINIHSENTYFYHKTEKTGQIFGKKQSGSTNPQSILWISMTSKEIAIPGTVTEIGDTIFQSCPNLTSISVESTSMTFSVQCGGLVVCSNNGSIGMSVAGGAVDIVINSPVKFLSARCCINLPRLETIKFHSGVVRRFTL